MPLNLEVFKILKMEQHNRWIWEGKNLWTFIEIWQNLYFMVIGGVGVCGGKVFSSHLGTNSLIWDPLTNSLPVLGYEKVFI